MRPARLRGREDPDGRSPGQITKFQQQSRDKPRGKRELSFSRLFLFLFSFFFCSSISVPRERDVVDPRCKRIPAKSPTRNRNCVSRDEYFTALHLIRRWKRDRPTDLAGWLGLFAEFSNIFFRVAELFRGEWREKEEVSHNG